MAQAQGSDNHLPSYVLQEKGRWNDLMIKQRLFLEAGDNPPFNYPILAKFITDKKISDVNSSDENGNTLLHYVLKNIAARKDGVTEQDYELVKFLVVNNNADLSLENNQHQTPLQIAMETRPADERLINLIKNGVDIKPENNLTPVASSATPPPPLPPAKPISEAEKIIEQVRNINSEAGFAEFIKNYKQETLSYLKKIKQIQADPNLSSQDKETKINHIEETMSIYARLIGKGYSQLEGEDKQKTKAIITSKLTGEHPAKESQLMRALLKQELDKDPDIIKARQDIEALRPKMPAKEENAKKLTNVEKLLRSRSQQQGDRGQPLG